MQTPKHFSEHNFTTAALTPLSWLYGFGLGVHQKFRKANVYRAPVPVISVGNILVGGTGKTPLVHGLVMLLAQHRLQVAVVTSSTSGIQRRPYKVTPNDDASLVGDEAKMLFDAFAHLPVSVWCGRNKKAMVKRAVSAGAQVVLIDDGMQRTDLAKDLEIVVMPSEQPFGNGKLLPAGPLREPVNALKRADIAVVMGTNKLDLAIESINLQPMLLPESIKPLFGKKLVAFAAIGNPQKFFDSLTKAGLNVVEAMRFGDHHQYTEADMERLKQKAKEWRGVLVTTAKDAVKLPADMRVTVPQLVLAGSAWDVLEKRVRALLNARS